MKKMTFYENIRHLIESILLLRNYGERSQWKACLQGKLLAKKSACKERCTQEKSLARQGCLTRPGLILE